MLLGQTHGGAAEGQTRRRAEIIAVRGDTSAARGPDDGSGERERALLFLAWLDITRRWSLPIGARHRCRRHCAQLSNHQKARARPV